MATFAGTPAEFMGNVLGQRIAPVATTWGSPVSYTPKAADTPSLAQVVCDGNSLTFGSGVAPGSEFTLNYVSLARPLLHASQASHALNVWRLINKGTGSIETPDMTARFDGTVHVHYDPQLRHNVVAMLEYINHRRRGATAQQGLDAYVEYLEHAIARGWSPMLFTVPPTGPSDIFFPGTGLDTSAINTWIRANVATYSPFPVVEIVTDMYDDPTDTSLWNADQVHPKDYSPMATAFHDIVAAIAT